MLFSHKFLKIIFERSPQINKTIDYPASVSTNSFAIIILNLLNQDTLTPLPLHCASVDPSREVWNLQWMAPPNLTYIPPSPTQIPQQAMLEHKKILNISIQSMSKPNLSAHNSDYKPDSDWLIRWDPPRFFEIFLDLSWYVNICCNLDKYNCQFWQFWHDWLTRLSEQSENISRSYLWL